MTGAVTVYWNGEEVLAEGRGKYDASVVVLLTRKSASWRIHLEVDGSASRTRLAYETEALARAAFARITGGRS